MNAPSGLFVADAAWPAIETRLAAGSIAVLPIGAASKEHGRHLPLNTDFVQAEWLARELVKRHDITVWPTLSYGYYPVFVDYPGSISLSAATFEAVVSEILDGIFHAGAQRIALLNTGISTIAPLEAVRGRSGRAAQLLLCHVYAGATFTACAQAVAEQPFGGHADEIETSLMLAIDASRVAMAQARPQATPIARGLFNRRDPTAPNYSPSGVNGDPTRATADKGRRLLNALLDDLSARLAAWQ